MKTPSRFRTLHVPLKPEELSKLRAGIKERGILDPLIVWKEQGILLDGYNRLSIAKELKLTESEIPVKELSFPDEDAAERWAIDVQMGRRNILPDEASRLRGKRFLLEKKAEGRPDKLRHNDGVKGETAERLAKEYGVSSRTIERDAEYAEAIETIEAVAPTVAHLAQPGVLSKKTVIAMAVDLKEDPKRADRYFDPREHEDKFPAFLPRTATPEERATASKLADERDRLAHAQLDNESFSGMVQRLVVGSCATEKGRTSIAQHLRVRPLPFGDDLPDANFSPVTMELAAEHLGQLAKTWKGILK